MAPLSRIHRHGLTLLTDLYQLTMAYAYWKNDLAEREAVFHLSYRTDPFGGRFTIACGLAGAIDFFRELAFDESDLAYLASLSGNDGKPLFSRPFLDYLGQLRFRCDVDAIAEGTVAFAHEPLVRVRGPLLQCQLMETPLLTLINFPTLIATKAARVCRAAQGEPVLEFGLRRAQGIDGGLSASRAAFIGGCAATSNLLAGKLFDIPVKGTHAHSWVMTFDSELESFRAYAAALPNNCTFLVDTYDTLAGVRHAITVGTELRQRGFEMNGIRLDSGDLAELSIAARRMLDEAGFPGAQIVASSDLDEYSIEQLNQRGATINVWGVGTRLATAYDQPALGGVYKLAALRDAAGNWQYRVKLSEHGVKSSDPGILQVRRFEDADEFQGDVIFNEPTGIRTPPDVVMLDGQDAPRLRGGHRDLLIPVFRDGRAVYTAPSAGEARQFAQHQLAKLADRVRRLDNPQPYSVGREARLHRIRNELIAASRGANP